MGFFRTQEEKLAARFLRWQYEKQKRPLPPETEILRQAMRIVDDAHRIAKDRGGNLLDITGQGLECRSYFQEIKFFEKILRSSLASANVEQVAAAILGDAVGVVDDPHCLPQNFGFRRQRPLLLLILPAQKPGGQLLF